MKDGRIYRLEADNLESGRRLADLALSSGQFEVVFRHLKAGDYLVERSVLVERKTHADLAASLIEGRLFCQAAMLARTGMRSLILVEGPASGRLPTLHPHSLLGAILSLSVIWGLPVVFSRDPEESLLILRLLAEQALASRTMALRRGGYRPRRLRRKQLYLLQGLPGVGPRLAAELLNHFGSAEKVMTAGEVLLQRVPGFGPKKARAIREVLV